MAASTEEHVAAQVFGVRKDASYAEEAALSNFGVSQTSLPQVIRVPRGKGGGPSPSCRPNKV